MTKGKIFVFSLFLAAEALLVEAKDTLALPSPRYHGETSVEQALNSRKTVRQFKEEAIELEELSQLLWAAGGGGFDGVTGATRTYPSAGGIYPLVLRLRSSVPDFGNSSSSAYYADLACPLCLTRLSYSILVRHSNACSALNL